MVAAARHTLAQREWIVRRLAAFETPKDVAAAFVARFPDTACSEADVLATDPRIAVVPPELEAMFTAERARLLADPSAAPYADIRAQAIKLSKEAESLFANNQKTQAYAVLRQIAELMGFVGTKGTAGAKGGAVNDGSDVVRITRVVIDPKGDDESDT